MQVNWSLILNVLLLIGVVVAIGRLMKARRKSLMPTNYQPTLGQAPNKSFDDIIAVRKLNNEEEPAEIESSSTLNLNAKEVAKPGLGNDFATDKEKKSCEKQSTKKNRSIMFLLLAKDNKQLAGYELLQTVLASGLRFGEGQLFHRHQKANGQGPVLCSLAAATASGVFDLQNIGAFSVRGLCLFMQCSGNPTIDLERFDIMYETAKQLSEGLNTYLLNEHKQTITEEHLNRYRKELAPTEDTLVD